MSFLYGYYVQLREVFENLQQQASAFSGLLQRRDLCHACERHTAWAVEAGYFRCTSCGRDPVEGMDV